MTRGRGRMPGRRPARTRRGTALRGALLAVLCLVAGTWAAPAGEAITHTTADGVELTVAPGRLRIRTPAGEAWEATYTCANLATDAAPPALTGVEEGTLSARQADENVAVAWQCRFVEEELRLFARIANTSGEEELADMHLRLVLTGPAPRGHGPALPAAAAEAWHPSPARPLGGAWLAWEGWGLGLAPAGPEAAPTRIETQTAGETTTIDYRVKLPVWPEGGRTAGLALQVTAGTEPAALLAPYRRHFAALWGGEVQYAPLAGALAVHRIPSAGGAVSETNPYGYAPGALRLDRAESVAAWREEWLPRLREAGVTVLFLDGVAGHDPRGVDYEVCFNLVPPEVSANLKQLSADLEAAGIRLGLAGSPTGWDVRLTHTTSHVLPLNPDDPRHLEHMSRIRFKLSQRDAAARAFLLESFGRHAGDVRAMTYYRQKLPEGLPTVADRLSDALLLQTPAAVALAADPQNGAIRPALPAETLAAVRRVVPEGTVVASLEGLAAEALPAAVAYARERAWVPLLSLAQLPQAPLSSPAGKQAD